MKYYEGRTHSNINSNYPQFCWFKNYGGLNGNDDLELKSNKLCCFFDDKTETILYSENKDNIINLINKCLSYANRK